MKPKKFLVVGATGHVGSKIAILLAEKGCDVTAAVRQKGSSINDPRAASLKYVTADLFDEQSMRNATAGIDVVISTANGIVPQRSKANAATVNGQAIRLIELCEQVGVKRFVQSSAPSYPGESSVPELHGKRLIEKRLFASSMQTIVVRNPAFMDVWLVISGFRQARDRSEHATTHRAYGFLRMWTALVGDFVQKRGLMIVPGGANHGTPIISTDDVAQMIVGGALYGGDDSLLIEAGGPEWLTWREIAAIAAKKVGRKKIRIIPIPGWLARLNQAMARPFSASAANIFALMAFVAEYQPHWKSQQVVEKFGLPKQLTVSDYLDLNYKRI